MTPHSAQLRRDLLLLFILFGLLYWGMSWTRPLANPDEGRYSEIPREMLESGDWVTPRLNGVLYFYKPPLFYWMQASAQAIGGESLFFLRFWPGALSLLGVLGTYLTARKLFGRVSGLASAAVLGTSLLYYGLGQIIILDMAVSVFMALGLFLFYLALHEEGEKRKWLFWAFYMSIALAVLSKGLMGLLIPGAVIFLWFLLLNEWKRLRNLYLVSGSLVFLIIALPWHIAAYRANPEWFDFYIIHEHFLRYLKDVSDRNQPFWYFFVIMPAGMMPWVVFLPSALKRSFRDGWKARREHSAMWFFGLTALFILLFFSVSKSKLIPYILPAYPSLAIIVGVYLANLWQNPVVGKSLRRICWGFAGLAMTGAIAMPIVAIARSHKLAPGAFPWFGAVMAVLAAAAFAMLNVLLRGRDIRRGLLVIFGGIYGFLLLFNPLAAQLQRPSTAPFAKLLKQYLNDNDEVYTFQDYYQDFPFYLGRPIGVAENLPNEQTYGMEWEPEQAERFPTQREVAERWDGPTHIFGLAKPDHAEQFAYMLRELGKGQIYVWKQTDRYELFANVPPPADLNPEQTTTDVR